MLEIINNLEPFFEDCYRRINVREYARIIKKSPPTASKLLNKYFKEGILKKEEYLNYMFFHANIESQKFTDLSKIYWKNKLKDLIEYLGKNIVDPTIILFGSLSKSEVKKDSDIDLGIFANKKELDLSVYERKLKRNIQIFWFKSIKDVKDKELANNIINGFKLKGNLRL